MVAGHDNQVLSWVKVRVKRFYPVTGLLVQFRFGILNTTYNSVKNLMPENLMQTNKDRCDVFKTMLGI